MKMLFTYILTLAPQVFTLRFQIISPEAAGLQGLELSIIHTYNQL